MADHWKYVMMDTLDAGETMLLFPPSLSHAFVAESLRPAQPISAGFVRYERDGSLACYGRSSTLNLEARPKEDSWYANLMLKQLP